MDDLLDITNDDTSDISAGLEVPEPTQEEQDRKVLDEILWRTKTDPQYGFRRPVYECDPQPTRLPEIKDRNPQLYAEWEPGYVEALEVQRVLRVEQEEKRRKGILDSAGVPRLMWEYSFASFEVHCLTRDNATPFEKVRRWASGEDSNRWLYVYGPTGSGKSGLAVAILRDHIDRSIAGAKQFLNYGDWLQALRDSAARQDDSASVINEEAREAAVLILDDLGAVKATPFALDSLYILLDSRYRDGKHTVITSMYDLPTLVRDHLGGEQVATALGWRISELATVLRYDEPNLRQLKVEQRLCETQENAK